MQYDPLNDGGSGKVLPNGVNAHGQNSDSGAKKKKIIGGVVVGVAVLALVLGLTLRSKPDPDDGGGGGGGDVVVPVNPYSLIGDLNDQT